MARLIKLWKTTTALGANASWTGSWIYVGDAQKVVGVVSADQAGTLYIEQSDAEVSGLYSVAQSYTAGTSPGFSVEVRAEFARLRYTNGATAQTSFRLFGYKVV